MKTLKSLVLGLALVIVANIAKADEPIPAVKLTKNYAVEAYVNSATLGQNTELASVIEDNAKFNILRGKAVMSFTKADLIKHANENKDVRQDCATTVSEVESNDDMSIVKVDMKYSNFTRTNYVTIANTGDGWKITNVYSVFK
ncbi:nuclear transport factor 2 family protein [uncultured Mucilaginibacter sp.]|uniref:nuclear transport factor 2 family protein n=1 Tax=uncultured Mucilaginibacter sp. TaxID=797541 RepID=UPI0025F184A4|nr:nuclear transport factor 2 family protein [uncultured Mucilaginibacter sp.]